MTLIINVSTKLSMSSPIGKKCYDTLSSRSRILTIGVPASVSFLMVTSQFTLQLVEENQKTKNDRSNQRFCIEIINLS
jgi:hypothetical protein